jgi:hypothetical protein
MSENSGNGGHKVWQISAVIEATEEQARQALDAIALALCPDPEHDGYCPIPWTTWSVRFDDLDEEDRAAWQAEFDEDRRRAEDAEHASPQGPR